MNSSVSMYESSEKSMKHMQLKGMGKGLMILTWGFFATAVAFFVLGYLDDKDVAEWLKWTTCIVLLIFLIIWLFSLCSAISVSSETCRLPLRWPKLFSI